MDYYPLPDMVPPDPSKPYLRAKKAMYGDPHGSKAWFEFWRQHLIDLGFTNVDYAGTVNNLHGPNGEIVLVATVVDDCIVGYSNKSFWLSVKAKLPERVEFDSTQLTGFSGFEVDYDTTLGLLKFTQTKLIEVAAKRFGINDQSKRYSTPMDENFMVNAHDCPAVPDP